MAEQEAEQRRLSRGGGQGTRETTSGLPPFPPHFSVVKHGTHRGHKTEMSSSTTIRDPEALTSPDLIIASPTPSSGINCHSLLLPLFLCFSLESIPSICLTKHYSLILPVFNLVQVESYNTNCFVSCFFPLKIVFMNPHHCL